MPDPRAAAAAIWRAALAAADVAPLLHRHLRLDGRALSAGPLRLDLDRVRRVLVLGAGKAGASMARTVEAMLGASMKEGFVVVKDGYRLPTARIEIAEAGHPAPDGRSSRSRHRRSA